MEFINKKYINAGSAFWQTITAWLFEVKKTFFCLFLIHIAAWMGISCTGISILVIIIISIRKIIWGDPVQGWASNMCVMIFLGGIQLFSLGIIGQYIGKMYTEIKKRPHYIVRERSDDFMNKIG